VSVAAAARPVWRRCGAGAAAGGIGGGGGGVVQTHRLERVGEQPAAALVALLVAAGVRIVVLDGVVTRGEGGEVRGWARMGARMVDTA